MFAAKVSLFCAGAIAVVSAIPGGLFDKHRSAGKLDLKKTSVKSFVDEDFNGGVIFTLMSQYRQGDNKGKYPDECPQMWAITDGPNFVANSGVVTLPYDRLKIWGNSSGLGEEPKETCLIDGHGRIELAESSLLQGGGELDDLRDSLVDISQVYEKTDEEIAAGTVVDEVRRLHHSVWVALRGKEYFTGKVDYDFRAADKQKKLRGIDCNGTTYFRRGELMLFIDEPETIKIQVKTAAERTSKVTLIGNRRYSVVTTPDSTCLYRVDADKNRFRDSMLNSDGTLELPSVCKAGCTCKCD